MIYIKNIKFIVLLFILSALSILSSCASNSTTDTNNTKKNSHSELFSDEIEALIPQPKKNNVEQSYKLIRLGEKNNVKIDLYLSTERNRTVIKVIAKSNNRLININDVEVLVSEGFGSLENISLRKVQDSFIGIGDSRIGSTLFRIKVKIGKKDLFYKVRVNL